MWSVLAVSHVTDSPGKHWVGSHETFLLTWTARMSILLLSCCNIVSLVTEGRCSQVHYVRGPQPLGHGPVPVCGLLGTGPYSKSWVMFSWWLRGQKHLPGMLETWVRSLGREDPLEKEMATHSSTLAWRIPWREEPGRLQSMGSQRVGHDWATSLSKVWYVLEKHRL